MSCLVCYAAFTHFMFSSTKMEYYLFTELFEYNLQYWIFCDSRALWCQYLISILCLYSRSGNVISPQYVTILYDFT
jgi:hypothetical protein